ncbi:MAG TPA: coproporphyrinogen III oxidase, partial [Ruminiclostridium sp.]|nr:coproporphyrinogen III oxidase [Ruminiclostridium sp.]
SSVTRDSFLGFGVSATTLLRSEFKINTFSIRAYIDRINEKKPPTSLTLSFTKRQRACYYLFWNSYGMNIDPKAFEDMIGKPLLKMYGFELWFAQRAGFMKREGNNYRLTDKGAYYYHYIEQAYTTSYIDKMWNISRLQAFPNKIILK